MRKKFILAAALLIMHVGLQSAEMESEPPRASSPEETVDLDEMFSDENTGENRQSAGEPSPAGARYVAPCKFSLFGDFSVNMVFNPALSDAVEVSFSREHAELFLSMESVGGVKAATDVIHIMDYLEFGFPLTAIFPGIDEISVLGTSEIRVGKILVPFGEYKYHHLYGGSVDAARNLVGVLWTDLGWSWRAVFPPGFSLDLYMLNGLRYSGFDFFLESAGDYDNNNFKALGVKLRYDFSRGFLSTSLLYDHFEVGEAWEGGALVCGLDGGVNLGALNWSAAGLYARGIVDSLTVVKWGWYNQLKFSLTSTVGLRCRLGQIDTNTALVSDSDLSSAALSLLLRLGIIDLDCSYCVSQVTDRLQTDGLNNGKQEAHLTFYFML